MKSFFAKVSTFTLLSLGLVAGSLAAPILDVSKVKAANPLDFVKEVKVFGTATYSQSTSPTASDTIIFRTYVYNPNFGTTVHNARLHDTLSATAGTVSDTSTITSTEVSYTSATNVAVPAGKRLDYIQGSTRVYAFNDATGTQIPDANGVGPLFAGNGITIGDIVSDSVSGSGDSKHWYVYQARFVDASIPVYEPAPRMDFTKTVANFTTNSSFGSSATISDGQVGVFKIWVHNGVTGSIARGEVLKDSLQTAVGTTHGDTASLSTSNAGNLSTSATLNTAIAQGLKYVPNSTKIIDHNGNVTAVADVGGTSPLFTDAGLVLGDQQGCFEFEKFITFQVTTLPVGAPPVAPIKPAVLAAVTQTPATGPESAPILALIGMIPAGLVLRRFKV